MTDQERVNDLVSELVDLANEIRRISRSQTRISVSLMSSLSVVENKALAAIKRHKEDKNGKKPTSSDEH